MTSSIHTKSKDLPSNSAFIVTDRLIPSESQEQAEFVTWVSYTYRNDPEFVADLFFAVPSGMWAGGSSESGKFGLIAKHRKEGWKKGISDILYLQPRGQYHYMAIEFKRSDMLHHKNGGLRPEQETFLDVVLRAGGCTMVAYGAEEAKEAFGRYMELERK